MQELNAVDMDTLDKRELQLIASEFIRRYETSRRERDATELILVRTLIKANET